MQQTIKDLHNGKTFTKNGKQLSYSEPHMAYVVNGIRTISIHNALKMMRDE